MGARALSSVAALLIPVAGGGCTFASLASSTGPRAPGHQWSTASHQRVHVGETVEFDFVLVDAGGNPLNPLGLADYVVVMLGGERIQSEPDGRGHFPFSYHFDRVEPGDRVTVEANAYLQRAHRDFMKVAGEWLMSESPYEIADTRVAGDSLTLEVYEAKIELMIDPPGYELDPDSGVLRIRRSDGRTTAVYAHRPDRPGFRLEGPDAAGGYRVTYTPDGDEVEPWGVTEVEFEVYDVSRTPHRATARIETP